ncbi:MAG: hypothetical protein AAF490_22710, partial [Chloroflexota bacterium]
MSNVLNRIKLIHAAFVIVFGFFLVACQSPQLSDALSEQLLFELLSEDTAVAQNALTQIAESNDIRFAPALIDLYWAGRVGLNEWSGSEAVIQ